MTSLLGLVSAISSFTTAIFSSARARIISGCRDYSTCISQGSVTARLRYSAIFSNCFTANFLENVSVNILNRSLFVTAAPTAHPYMPYGLQPYDKDGDAEY